MASKSYFFSERAKALCSALTRNALLVMVALALIGCRLPSQEGLKSPYWGTEQADIEQPAAAQTDQGLIKPTIPPERQMEEAGPPQQGQPPRPVRVVIEPQADPKPQKNDWEDDRIRSAAIEMARATPSVKKMKICLDIKHSEWWVILYEDLGPAIELRQFVWNKDQKRFEPHLVLDRIPREQLERHASESEPGRACEAVEVGGKP